MWNSQKIKSVKNIIKKVSYKSFQVCISLVYDSFILEFSISSSISTALLLWMMEGKIRTSFKTLISNKTTIWRLKKSHSNNKFLEKITSSSYHMEQKHSSKQVASRTYTLEKDFFCGCYFWRFVSCLDSETLKNLKRTLVCTNLLLLL